ncbi:hypothetical protein QJS66_09290 [Kocuria rhizophila]|nr:hypothetical protein QJS66_09290 [Kocuria rhizophila]
MNLVLRFYEIDGGRITLDGIDVRDLAHHSLRCPGGHGAAGRVAVQRHDSGEHPLWPPGRRGRGGGRGGAGHVRDRFVQAPAGRLRHRDQ